MILLRADEAFSQVQGLSIIAIGGAVVGMLLVRSLRAGSRVATALVVILVLGVLLAAAVGQLVPNLVPLPWVWTVVMSSGAVLAILGVRHGMWSVAVLGWSTALLNAPGLNWIALLFLDGGVRIIYALYGALCVYLSVGALRVIGERRRAVAAGS